ncbi:MAG: polyphosphate kinase 1 [Thermoleophilia bacterium]
MAAESENPSRADEYRGRQATKQATQASHEEFLPDPLAAELADADLRDPALYVNRELSMLDFFERVLYEARDPGNPLLERVKFVGIVGSILGEFFMVRIAGLRQQVEAGVTELSADGHTPQQLLPILQDRAWAIMKDARRCFSELLPELDAAGVHILDHERLADGQRAALDEYYRAQVFPVLTPLAFDPGRPFPHISNMSHNLAVLIRDQTGEERFARVKVPPSLPRLVPVPAPDGVAQRRGAAAPAAGGPEGWFTWLEQIIAAHLDTLFPGLEVVASYPFRVTRDAELAIQELEADDLLETIERFVRRRRFGSVVRVTVDETMPERIRGILSENLELGPRDLYEVRSPLGLSSLWDAASADRPDLKFAPLVQTVPPSLNGVEGSDIFAAIRQRDVLLLHPYDSFDPMVELMRAAANDPDVLAIKQTLYRVGRNAPVVEQLMEAAANGKQVAVLVELKARFDEESNIGWAKALEHEGAHVVYGLIGMKTHCKALLIVRREGDRIRRYTHLGTGNYNSVTTKQYTDLGYLTADDEIGADAAMVFNQLTGYGVTSDYGKLLVAPVNLRQGMEARIDREIEHARRGEEAHLIFKMNSLVDKPMIRRLYRASQAGVKVELNVRGMCCLRPGLPGISENISERSVVGRFLEHSRIYWFRNGGDEEILLGSADLMPRNLNRRVEVLFPVRDGGIVRRLRDEVLAKYLADNAKTRVLRPDGAWEHIWPGEGEDPLNAQEWFVAQARENACLEEAGA